MHLDSVTSKTVNRTKMSSSRPKPSTSKSASKNPKVSAPKQETGGGGQESSHGLVFHLNIAMLLLFRLKEMSQNDLGLQYHVWLEKKGYGKFDDIVVRYKKSGGKWIKICVQCKHKQDTLNFDGTKTVKDITAHDFLSNDNKQLSLAEYVKSFREIKDKGDEERKYYIILSNMVYANGEVPGYDFFQCEDLVELHEVTDIFGNNGFKIKYNHDLSYKLSKEMKTNIKKYLDLENIAIADFCEKFLYVCDNRDLENELQEKLSKHCKYNDMNIKNLKARLYYLVSQMYQHKLDPNQNDFVNEFNGCNIFYHVQPACPHFTGRVDEILKIKNSLEHEKGRHLFDLLVTGMAGMGKTQTVRKYIEENKHRFKHIVWLNAESKDSLENSFVDLAKTCHLITNDCNEDISSIVKSIYLYFEDHTLFVFDNTNKLLLKKDEKNEFIYLPNYEKTKSNKFAIISQDVKWTTNYNAVKVNAFSEDDALQYLNVLNECTKEEREQLAATFQHWPLALCLAASYINLETENSLGEKSCSDVIKTLQIDNENFHQHVPQNHEMQSYIGSLNSLWLLLREKLHSYNELSIKIIYMFSLSEPDNFPLDLLKFKDFSKDLVNNAVTVLVCNSLVTVTDYRMSIHRTLQAIIRNNIISNVTIYEGVLTQGIECFSRYLESIDLFERKQSFGNSHMVSFLHHICRSQIEPHIFNEMSKDLLQKLVLSRDLGGHSEHDGIFDTVLTLFKQKLGAGHEYTLEILMAKCLMLKEVEKYEESLNIFNALIDSFSAKFGTNNPMYMFYFYFKAVFLEGMGHYEEALEIYNDVFLYNLKIYGEFHYKTLASIHRKAVALNNLGKHEDALNIFIKLNKTRTEMLGEDNDETIASMNDQALVLYKMDRNEESLLIYNRIIDIMINKFGKNNYETLTAMLNKTLVLEDLGNFSESLDIQNHIINEASVTLGVKHTLTLASMRNKASVLFKMGNYEESLSFYNHVIETRREILGDDHPDILIFLVQKASVLKKMEKYEDALDIYNKTVNVIQTKLGRNHPDTLSSMSNQASILNKIGKFDEALIIYNQLIELISENKGKSHPLLLEHIQTTASILDTLGRYDEALSKYNHIIDEYAATLGDNHQTTLHCVYMKSVVLFKMENFDGALHTLNHLIEKQIENFGINHPKPLRFMLEKAALLDKAEKCNDALSVYNEIYKVKSEMLGENKNENISVLHDKALAVLDDVEKQKEFLDIYQNIDIELLTIGINYFQTMHKKALVLKKMGMYEESLIVFDYLTELRMKIFGKEHIETLASMSYKTSVLVSIGKFEEALKITNQVIDVQLKDLGKNHVNTIFSMKSKAFILNKLLQYEETLRIYDEIWKVESEIYGEKHSNSILILNNKAAVLIAMGKRAEALNIYNHLIRNFSDTLDENDTSRFRTILSNKAWLLINWGKYDEALQFYDHINVVYSKTLLETQHNMVLMRNKASLLDKMGRNEEALKINDNLIEIYTERLGANHFETVNRLKFKVFNLIKIEKYEESLVEYNHIIKMMTEKLGKNHLETLQIMTNKASLLYAMKKYVEALSIINHVIEIMTEVCSENHLDIAESIRVRDIILNRLQENLKRLYFALYVQN